MASSPPDAWALRTEKTGDETRVYFTGSAVTLDETNTAAIHDQMIRLVDALGPAHLLLDLANVTYLNSSTLGMLLQVHKKLQPVGGRLTLINLQPHIHEIFTITNLTQLLEIRPTDTQSYRTGVS